MKNSPPEKDKIKSLYSTYLCCPDCSGGFLVRRHSLRCAACKRQFPLTEGIPELLPKTLSGLSLTISKWDAMYRDMLRANRYEKEEADYISQYYADMHEQIDTAKSFTGNVFLEIGCGPMYFGQRVAKECRLVIGIDICPSALKIAKKMFVKKGIRNFLLVRGDILHLPINSSCIDSIYGGGVIEHFSDTRRCIAELFRVLKKRGVSFNTVPLLNIASLTYRQLWGNIPNVPGLKSLYELIHVGLLRARHMRFGYEMSFLPMTLRRLHRDAGFRNVTVDRFRVKLVFEYLPAILRKPLEILAVRSILFWPMVKVIARK